MSMSKGKILSLISLLILALILGGCARNKPPTATIDSPKDKAELASKAVEFKGTGTDPEKKAVTYAWDFGDGKGKSTEQNPKYTYEKPGTYTVTFTVTDDKKAKKEVKITITVKNASPKASASASPTSGEVPLTVQFDSAGSADPDGPAAALKFSWDFGDGKGKSTEAKPKYTYDKEGNYTATLTVTDGDGATAKATVTITVKPPAPTSYEVKAMETPDGRYVFEPAGLLLKAGDKVKWVTEEPGHSTVAYHTDNGKMLGIPMGAKSWSQDLVPGTPFELTFTVEGTYVYFCKAHEEAGMVGIIVVGKGTAPSEELLKSLPPAAREALPSVDEIMQKKKVSAKVPFELAKKIITAQNCGACHTLKAAGLDLAGKVGPDLTHEAQKKLTDEQLKAKLTSAPHTFKLTDEEIKALIAFLQSLNSAK